MRALPSPSSSHLYSRSSSWASWSWRSRSCRTASVHSSHRGWSISPWFDMTSNSRVTIYALQQWRNGLTLELTPYILPCFRSTPRSTDHAVTDPEYESQTQDNNSHGRLLRLLLQTRDASMSVSSTKVAKITQKTSESRMRAAPLVGVKVKFTGKNAVCCHRRLSQTEILTVNLTLTHTTPSNLS